MYASRPRPRRSTAPQGGARARSSSTPRPLAAELAGRSKGEVRFDAGSRALYATDGSNYRQVPIGVVIPHDVDDVVNDRRRLPPPRCAASVAGRRHEPDRRLLQRRGRHGLVEASQQGPLDRPGDEAGAGAAGDGARRPPHPGREAPPDLRPRPLDPHAQHAGRDDRQQLLRRPLADGPGDRAGRPTRSTSWTSCSTTAPG